VTDRDNTSFIVR